MINPLYESTRSRKRTEYDRLADLVVLGRARIGPDAAREIAQRIERQGGFWSKAVSR
jgi:hypothetical protein